MTQSETVLVTGGSGYIGSWCVIELLRRGYAVRATVRDLSRADAVRAAIGNLTRAGDALSFHAANLTSDAGWDEAAAGADYLVHVASPLGVPPPKDANELIVPARDGALRAIGAAIKAGVKRVVMTSSVAAASPPFDAKGDRLGDEAVWSDGEDARIGPYARSKTIAERAAWDLVASSGGSTTLTTVNPVVVVGPVISGDFSDSVQLVQRLLNGNMPGLPRLGFSWVDVRDVADLHLRCMTAPEAAGQRFIAAGEFAWMADIARLLRDNLGAEASKVPTRTAPDILLRVAALFDRDLKTIIPNLGLRHDFTSAKAQSVLGWRPRPLKDTVLDCARSLIAAGAV